MKKYILLIRTSNETQVKIEYCLWFKKFYEQILTSGNKNLIKSFKIGK